MSSRITTEQIEDLDAIRDTLCIFWSESRDKDPDNLETVRWSIAYNRIAMLYAAITGKSVLVVHTPDPQPVEKFVTHDQCVVDATGTYCAECYADLSTRHFPFCSRS